MYEKSDSLIPIVHFDRNFATHICQAQKRKMEKKRFPGELWSIDRASPVIEYAHYNFVADAHLSMSLATSNAFYSFYNSTLSS